MTLGVKPFLVNQNLVNRIWLLWYWFSENRNFSETKIWPYFSLISSECFFNWFLNCVLFFASISIYLNFRGIFYDLNSFNGSFFHQNCSIRSYCLFKTDMTSSKLAILFWRHFLPAPPPQVFCHKVLSKAIRCKTVLAGATKIEGSVKPSDDNSSNVKLIESSGTTIAVSPK